MLGVMGLVGFDPELEAVTQGRLREDLVKEEVVTVVPVVV